MADEKSVEHEEDQELNDLLDSALKDFTLVQQVDKAKATKKEDSDEPKMEKKNETPAAVPGDVVDDAWATDFFKQAAEHFDENLQNFLENEAGSTDLRASIQKVAQSMAEAVKDEDALNRGDISADFQTAIDKALSDLSATSENLQQGKGDLADMFGQVSLEDGAGAVLPFMQEILQHLLSRDTLYPALKDLVDKYPKIIEEKKETLTPSDLDRFRKQLDLIQQVCSEFEMEDTKDSGETKKKRFEKIMLLMHDLQAHGQLPEELVGKQSPFQFDADADAALPQNCAVM